MEFDGNLSLRKSHIKRLDYYLNYQLSSSVLGIIILSGATMQAILVMVLILAACVFTPFMLFVLFKEKKFGWIITFLVMVVIPFSWAKLFVIGPASTLISSIMVGLFYLYCFLLKMSTREWVSAENARNQLAHQRMLKKLKDDEFNSRYNK